MPGGPVGPPARWAATSNVKEGSGTEEGAQGPLAGEGGLYLDKLFAEAPEFLVTPLLMAPVRLISQGQFEEPVRLCNSHVNQHFVPPSLISGYAPDRGPALHRRD